MKIKAYKTEDEIPEGAVYMYTEKETKYVDHPLNVYRYVPESTLYHFFLVKEKLATYEHIACIHGKRGHNNVTHCAECTQERLRNNG